ncbi:MAG: hypothetical protein K0R20_1395 [Actinomycetia bacterium]|jgi:hypothetical protein|nr:hypothetical protein [Actinomycetes bacterium]
MPPGGQVPSRPRSGRGPVLVVAILLLAVALVIFLMRAGSDGFPDSALGYERLHSEDADRAERAVEDIRVGDVEIRGAVYGSGDEPELFAALYENYPAGVEAETIIQGAASGAETSGGAVDQGSLRSAASGGYSFACMSGGGPGFLIPGGPSRQGVLCVFQGELVGVLVTTHTEDPTLGLAAVRAFVEALEAA